MTGGRGPGLEHCASNSLSIEAPCPSKPFTPFNLQLHQIPLEIVKKTEAHLSWLQASLLSQAHATQLWVGTGLSSPEGPLHRTAH